MTETDNDALILYVATGSRFARIMVDGDGLWNTDLSLEGHAVQCLAADPTDRATVYAGTRGDGLWKTQDGGQHWRQLALAQPDVFSVAVSAADGAVYAGTEPSRLYASRDGGATWRELSALRDLPSAPGWSFPPRPWTSHVRSIAPSPHDAARLIVGIELGGLMLSEDGGGTWADHRPGAQRDVHALAWHPKHAGHAYEAAGGGAAWSQDGGKTWEPADKGRNVDYCWGLAVHPDHPDIWFVSTAPGPREAHDADRPTEAAIYRWQGKGPWQQVTRTLDSMPYALDFARGRLFAGLDDGHILVSHDQGDNWDQMRLGGDPISRIEALVAV